MLCKSILRLTTLALVMMSVFPASTRGSDPGEGIVCKRALEPISTVIAEIPNPNGALNLEEVAAISREVNAINLLIRPHLRVPPSISILPRFTKQRNFARPRIMILSYQNVIRPLVDPEASQQDLFAARALLAHEYGHVVFHENTEAALYDDNGFADDLEKYRLSWIDYLVEDAPALRNESWANLQQEMTKGFYYHEAYFLWQYTGVYDELFADLVVALYLRDQSAMFLAKTHLQGDPEFRDYFSYLAFDVNHFDRPTIENNPYTELARARTLIGQRHLIEEMSNLEGSRLLKSVLETSVPEILYLYGRTNVHPHLPFRNAEERAARLADGIRERLEHR